MKHSFGYISLLALSALLAAVVCSGAESAISSRRTVAGPFSALRVSGSLPVELRQVPDSAGTVLVEASDRAMQQVHVANADGTLSITFHVSDPARHYGREIRKITVYCGRDLHQIVLNGSGAVSAAGLKTQTDITAVLSGSGCMSLASVDCRNFTASLSGSGDMRLSGVRARNVSTSLSGSGDLSVATDATSFNCTVSGSGTARAEGVSTKASLALRGSGTVDAARLRCPQLTLSAAGSGVLRYDASAAVKIVSGRISSPGTLTK